MFLFTARQCLDNNLIRIGMFVCRLINCPPSFSPLTSPICSRDVILGNFRDIMRNDCSLIGSYRSHVMNIRTHVMNINEERRDQSRRCHQRLSACVHQLPTCDR